MDLIFEENGNLNIDTTNYFTYKKGDYLYWIKFDDIMNKLKTYKNCFILTTGFKEAKLLKNSFYMMLIV